MIPNRPNRGSMTISVLLADGHAIFREGVRTLLETNADFKIIGEAGNGKEVLALAEHLHPDVVVLDYVMPGLNGMDVTWQLHTKQPQTHVVILSMHADKAYILKAIDNGARGYVAKEDIVDHLIKAVRAAAAGRPYFSPCLGVSAILSGIGDKIGCKEKSELYVSLAAA
jgi:DNA-binding NarL/FixJ family response regulator